MKAKVAVIALLLMANLLTPNIVKADKIVRLATINWEPYTGENLPDHGFFSELVNESLARVGYHVEFVYLPWARALHETKLGHFDGLMNVYWKKDRTKYFSYPDSVWTVKEEFIALRHNPINYNGTLTSLRGYTIGVLNNSAQAEEIKSAGVNTEPISYQFQNVKKLLAGRFDAMVIPRNIFLYYLKRVDPNFDKTQLKILKPPFKIYEMYVTFSKQNPAHQEMTADFNRGLNSIKSDGTYENILNKHNIRSEF